jgi:hypothetical protein
MRGVCYKKSENSGQFTIILLKNFIIKQNVSLLPSKVTMSGIRLAFEARRNLALLE